MSFVSTTNPFSAGTYSPGGAHDPLDVQQTNQSSKFQKPNLPTPPDYKSLIDEQSKMGRINQNTPFGSLQFMTDPKTGQISANYSMTPQEKALYSGLQGGEQSLLGATAGGAPQFNAMGPLQSIGKFNPGNYGNQIRHDEQSSFNDAMALMDPQLKMQQDQLNQSMADRGLPIGSEIQANSQNQFDQYRGGLMTQAAYNALGMGQQEQAQGFNQNLNSYGANQNANIQNYDTNMNANLSNYGAGLQGYNSNMASLGSLFNMGNSMPGLNQFFAPQGANVNGSAALASNAAQQNYASQMQQYGSNMGGLYSLGGALGSAFIASDRRLKHDIKRIGKTDAGLPIYVFRYNGSNDIAVGVMADEAKKLFPDAVITHIDGYDRVDYMRIN